MQFNIINVIEVFINFAIASTVLILASIHSLPFKDGFELSLILFKACPSSSVII